MHSPVTEFRALVRSCELTTTPHLQRKAKYLRINVRYVNTVVMTVNTHERAKQRLNEMRHYNGTDKLLFTQVTRR